jgi:hypothetical protein
VVEVLVIQMSYDLMVFDPASVPCSRRGFLKWYDGQQAANEDLPPSDDPKSLTPPLQTWFAEMIQTFPPLNGPLSTGDVENPKVTDYGLGRTYVYACFGWSEAEAAFRHVKKLAEKHRVGFFNVSSEEGDVWFPGSRGELEKAAE